MNFKHGGSKTKLHPIWRQLRYRCNCKTNQAYANYGARGITVCAEWNDSFFEFKKWALENGYKEGLTIERIDNDLGYSPNNCIFTTYKENNRNQRSSKWWVVDGIRYESLRDAAEKLGVSGQVIQRWCSGYISDKGKYNYPPKQNCYSELKYVNNHR